MYIGFRLKKEKEQIKTRNRHTMIIAWRLSIPYIDNVKVI
jgi:hypothetical protein